MAQQNWEQLYEEWGDALVLYARQFISTRHEAEDIVHDAFIQLFGKKRQLSHPNPKALLFQSVRWPALDRLKKDQRRQTREEIAATDLFETEGAPTPKLEDEEFAALISKLLWNLPDAQREVLVLHLWDEFSFREIGEILGISTNTAASRYRYGIEQLRGDSKEILEAKPGTQNTLTID